MMKTMIAAALLSITAFATTQADDQNHGKAGHQHRSEAYEQKSTQQATTAAAKPTADGKRLPGRDCKLYEGATRQHTFPQYEIGNPNRPECPSA